ncbi:hypothetical protein ACHAXN_011950 [Cyclotella atomus]
MRAIFVIVLLLNVPIGRFILYPFILFWTWIHELFHGLAAISVGGKIDWLNIYPDGSGLAYTVIPDGIFQRVWVAAAGYQGIAIVGGILLMFRRTALGVRVGTCGIGLIMLLSCILFVIWFGCIGTDRAAVDISRIVSYTIWNCNNVSQCYYINRNVVFCHGIQYWWSKSIIRCNNDDARFNKDTVSVVGFNLIGIGVLDDSLWGFHCPRLKMMITALLLNQTMANWLKAFRRPSPVSSKLGQVNRNTFHSDGVTCAPGTPAGKVLCYDLRKSASPISKWEAKDREPVTCVRFEHLEAPSDASIGSEKAKSVQTHSNEAYKSSRELHSAVDEAVLNLARTKKKERSSESDVENDSLVNNSKHTGASKTNGLKNKLFKRKAEANAIKWNAELKQQHKAHSDKLEAIQKEVRGLRYDMECRVEALRSEVLSHFKEQSNQLASLSLQHVELVKSLREENRELKEEVERLRRF